MSDIAPSTAYYEGFVDSAIRHYCWLRNSGTPDCEVINTMNREFSDALKSLDAFYGVDKHGIELVHAQDWQKFCEYWSKMDELAKQPEFALMSDPYGTCLNFARETALFHLSKMHERDISNFNIRYMLERAALEKRHDEIMVAVQRFIKTGKMPIPSGFIVPYVCNIKNEPEPTELEKELAAWSNMPPTEFDFAFAPSGDESPKVEATSWLPDDTSASYSEMLKKPQEEEKQEVVEPPVVEVPHKELRKHRKERRKQHKSKGTIRIATREHKPRERKPRSGTRGKNRSLRKQKHASSSYKK